MLPLSDDEEIVEGVLRQSNKKIEDLDGREYSSSGRPEKMMSFEDAVKNVLINNYMNHRGRASRSEYWWFYLFLVIVQFITGIIDGFVFGWDYNDPVWISNIVFIATTLPSIALAARRLHDVGRSGWWILISVTIIGIIPLFIWSVMEGEEHPNQYGEVPTNIIENDDYERYGTF